MDDYYYCCCCCCYYYYYYYYYYHYYHYYHYSCCYYYYYYYYYHQPPPTTLAPSGLGSQLQKRRGLRLPICDSCNRCRGSLSVTVTAGEVKLHPTLRQQLELQTRRGRSY